MKVKDILPYLFDLKNGPFELNNIYEGNEGIVKQMFPALKNCLQNLTIRLRSINQ